MSVPAKAFAQWLHAAAPGTSTAAICRLSGIKRSTLAQQQVRGRVSVSTIVAISRALKLNVVDALAGFEKYADLVSGAKPPSEAELISQISDADLLQEILRREAAIDGGEASPDWELSPAPHRTSVRNWIDAVGPPDLRQQLAKDAGIAPQNISSQLSGNRLSEDLAVAAARLAGVGLTNGLVVTGVITMAEAGWSVGSRRKALHAMPSSALAALAAVRLDAMSKTFRRNEQDDDASATLWENLG